MVMKKVGKQRGPNDHVPINAIEQREKASVMEVFGSGSVTTAADRRKSMNIVGLDAMDIRNMKPTELGDETWDFSRRRDRKQALELQRSKKPTWLIGSPPCTDWCTFNQRWNFPKMDPKKVEGRMRRAKAHIRCCLEMYRRQLLDGRHFST